MAFRVKQGFMSNFAQASLDTHYTVRRTALRDNLQTLKYQQEA